MFSILKVVFLSRGAPTPLPLGRLRIYYINSLKPPNFLFSSRKIIYARQGESAHANLREVRGTRSYWSRFRVISRGDVLILAFDNAQSQSIRPRAANFTFVGIRSLSPLYA